MKSKYVTLSIIFNVIFHAFLCAPFSFFPSARQTCMFITIFLLNFSFVCSWYKRLFAVFFLPLGIFSSLSRSFHTTQLCAETFHRWKIHCIQPINAMCIFVFIKKRKLRLLCRSNISEWNNYEVKSSYIKHDNTSEM